MEILRRLTAAMLVLVMVVTMLPLSAMAEEVVGDGVLDVPETAETEVVETAPETTAPEVFVEKTAEVVNADVTASGTCGENVTWSFDETMGMLTISGTGEMSNFDVMCVPWQGFIPNIKTVVISDGITTIGDFAFYECMNLTNIVIPDSVIAIGTETFCGCFNLMDLQLPDGLKSIGSYAFSCCSGIEELVVPEYITSISDGAFADFDSLVKVTMNNNVTYIGGFAFAGCDSLTSVVIPNSVQKVGECIFEACSNLEEICYMGSKAEFMKIDGYELLPDWNIRYNVSSETPEISEPDNSLTYLDELEIVASDRYTGNQGDSFIDKIGTRNSTTDIHGNVMAHGLEAWIARWNYKRESSWAWAEYALNGLYTNLTGKLTIVSDAYNTSNFDTTIEILGDGELLKSYVLLPDMDVMPIEVDVTGVNILRIYVYDNVAVKGGTSFALWDFAVGNGNTVELQNKCGDNVTWKLDDEGTLTISGDGDMYDYSPGNLPPWYNSREKITAYVIEEGVTNIGSHAFINCFNMDEGDCANSVTRIGNAAFMGCSKFPSFVIPSQITYVGDNAFYKCSKIKLVIIEGQIPSIGESTFRDCSGMISISISSSVTEIGNNAFSGCTALTEAFYSGSAEQWEMVSIGSDNDCLTKVMNLGKQFELSIDEAKIIGANKESAICRITASISNNSRNIALTDAFCSLTPGMEAKIIIGDETQRITKVDPLSSAEFEWQIQIDRSCYPDGGTHFFTIVADSNETIIGMVNGSVGLEAVNGQSNILIFPEDVWSFENFKHESGCLILEEHKKILLQNLRPAEKVYVEYRLQKGNKGHCYGMAACVVLEKMNAINLAEHLEIQNLGQAKRIDYVESLLCYYQATQFLPAAIEYDQDYQKKTPAERLAQLAEKAAAVRSGGCLVSLAFSIDTWGGHQVVAYDLERGEFKSKKTKKTYDSCILLYDSNTVNQYADTKSWRENYCLLFNEGTDEWEIPCYVPKGTAENDNSDASLTGCSYELQMIDVKNYDVGVANYSAELHLKPYTQLILENLATGEKWKIEGTTSLIQGDSELMAYWGCDADNSESIGDLHIVLPDELADYRITTVSGDAENLDLNILFDDRYVSVTANAAGFDFSDDGAVVLNGNESSFEIVIADDNISEGSFNTYSIVGDKENDLTISLVKEGLSIEGTDLKGITIEASEGDISDSVTIQTDMKNVEISRDSEELVIAELHKLGDVNHDTKINAKDATLILQKSVGVLKPTAKFCEECAEVSGDGKLNAKDSTLILQFSVGLRDSFPAGA